jgi:hypothetical protein
VEEGTLAFHCVACRARGPPWRHDPGPGAFIDGSLHHLARLRLFYDQTPPPVTPKYTKEGPRVPLIIVSPYAKARYTDTTPAAFASILRYTEHNFGLVPLGPNDAYIYDFANAFNYAQAPCAPYRWCNAPLPPQRATCA